MLDTPLKIQEKLVWFVWRWIKIHGIENTKCYKHSKHGGVGPGSGVPECIVNP